MVMSSAREAVCKHAMIRAFFDNAQNMFLIFTAVQIYARLLPFFFLSYCLSFEEEFLAVQSRIRGRSKLQDVRKVMPDIRYIYSISMSFLMASLAVERFETRSLQPHRILCTVPYHTPRKIWHARKTSWGRLSTTVEIRTAGNDCQR